MTYEQMQKHFVEFSQDERVPEIIRQSFARFNNVEIMDNSTITQLVKTMVAFGYKVTMPQYAPIKRLISVDKEIGRFVVPWNKREPDADKMMQALRLESKKYTLPYGPEYQIQWESTRILVPMKWHYWRFLAVLVNDWGYRRDDLAQLYHKAFMDAIAEKDIEITASGGLLLHCIPDFRMQENNAKWNGNKFSSMIYPFHLIKSRNDNDIVNYKGKPFTGFSSKSFRYSFLKELIETFGFSIIEGTEQNPHYIEAKIAWLRDQLFAQLARGVTLFKDMPGWEKYPAIDLNGHSLKEFQASGLQFIDQTLQENTGVIVADAVGAGKTIMAIAYAKLSSRRMIVLPPANLVENWTDEYRKFVGNCIVVTNDYNDKGSKTFLDAFRQLSDVGKQALSANLVVVVKGRRVNAVLAELFDYAQMVILPHSVFSAWTDELKATLSVSSANKLLIVDEAHKFKNWGKSKVASSYIELARTIRDSEAKAIVMTATLISREPIDIWPHTFLCYPGWYYNHRDTFVRYFQNWPQGVYEELRHKILYRRHEDIPDMPVLDFKGIFSKLPEDVMDKYQRLIVALEAIMAKRYGRPIPKLPWYTYMKKAIGRLKTNSVIDAVRAYRASHPNDKVLVFAHHRVVIAQLQIGLGCNAITGGMSANRRDTIKNAFVHGNDMVLVASTTMSQGWNAETAKVVFFAELDWNWINIFQAGGRAARITNKNKVILANMSVCLNTFETKLHEIMMEKKATEWAVMNGYELPDDGDDFFSRVVEEIFPGIQFGSMHGYVVNDSVTNEDIENIVDEIIGAPTASDKITIRLETPYSTTDRAILDSGPGHVSYGTIDSGDRVPLLICHADETGKISDGNEDILARMPANAVIVSCYPAMVAERYNVAAVGDWETVTLYSQTDATTLKVWPKE